MPDVANPRPERTTKEHLVEAGLVAAALLPLGVISAPWGWWLERRHEFSARHRHGISFGSLGVAVLALLVMGLPAYASGWAGALSDLATWQAKDITIKNQEEAEFEGKCSQYWRRCRGFGHKRHSLGITFRA